MKIRVFQIFSVALAVLVAFGNFAFAAGEDEQWPMPDNPAFGHHSVLIQDNDIHGTAFSLLTMQSGENNYICSSLQDPKCASATSGRYRAMLPACVSETDYDCIVGLEAVPASGVKAEGKLVEYIYGNKHPNEFTGDGKNTPLHAGDPSIWSIPGAPHAFGSEYGVVVGLDNNFQVGQSSFTDAAFYMNIFPISRMATAFTAPDINGYANYAKCQEKKSGEITTIGCGAGAQEFGKYRCALKMIEGATCLLQHAFPRDVRYKLVVRLGQEPSGMLHGRIRDPQISITPGTNFTTISVEAGTVQVPVLYSGGDWNSLSADLKQYWDQCISTNLCGFSTRQATGNIKSDPLRRNVQDYALPYGDRSLKLISTFANSVKDTSVAAPTSWNIRTLGVDRSLNAPKCFTSGVGFKGVVTTNSTTYSEGPPAFEDGNLNYKVASLHYLPNGDVFKGNYNLVLRSDVARCLYGFSKAPISASISILSADGSNQVATTVVNERDNWLYLTAAGFTFSSPTIKVKLTQETPVASPTPTSEMTTQAAPKAKVKKITITCVKGQLKKKLTASDPKCPNGYKKVAK